MITIKITDDSFASWPLIRQTMGGKGIWNDCRFIVNQQIEECDAWVVYGDIDRVEVVNCPPENTVFITTEPESIRQYQPGFIQQFATVMTFRDDLIHNHIIRSQPALPWHLGKIQTGKKQYHFNQHYDYDYLKALGNIPKTKDISVITSNKTISEGHRNRLNFVRILAEHFGSRLDVFGQGINDIADKWDAIASYKYHIVIENSSYSDYWTEKLADAFLAGAYPIYHGCPNVHDYFEPLVRIDLERPDEAIKKIAACLESNTYEQSMPAIQNARNLVLDKYNLFNTIAEYVSTKLAAYRPKQSVKIYPDKYCRDNLKSRLIHTFF